MQIDWIVKDSNNSKLLIVALGWGASREVVGNQVWLSGYDVVALCDYRSLEYDKGLLPLSDYEGVTLVAWSFGVWASEQLFSGVRFEKAIAIAGTPRPIDKIYGIDPRVFRLTLSAIMQEGGVAQFVVRMCGKHLREYLKNHSQRHLNEIQEELQHLNTVSPQQITETIRWTKAVIPAEDLIFSVRNMENYWTSRSDVQTVILENTPHYPFYDKEFILCTINS